MEERKLNFNAPLMSVRRFSKASSSLAKVKVKKSEDPQLNRRSTFPVSKPLFNLDQVTEPVAVPFYWEQIPGRAKNDSGSASPEVHLPRTCSTPRHSFGRVFDVKKHSSEMEVCDRNGCEEHSSNAIVVRLDSMIASDARSLASEYDDDDDDGDDFSDARETLSLTGSFSINDCSVSGISGYNGPMMKPSGTFRTDPQTRDFMMSRFLPAAKAMVLEPSKYSLKKQLVAVEQPRQVKKVTPENRWMSPVKRVDTTLLLQYGEDEVHKVDEADEDSDSVDDEYDNSGNISARGCGLIPNICFKNSLGLLNPVPGMRIRTEAPMSITNKDGGSSRTMHHSHSQKMNKHAWDAAYKQKSEAAAGSPKLQEVKDKWTGESKHFPSSTDVQMRGRSSPFRHSRAASPFRNEASWSPCRKQTLVVPKDDTDFRDTPSIRETKHGVDMASTLIEKTLYIDTASVAERTPPLNSSLLDAAKKFDCANRTTETAFETRVMEETTTVEPSFLEMKCLTLVEEGRMEREAAESKSKYAIDDESDVEHGLYKGELSGFSNVGNADENEYSKANYQLVKLEDPAYVKGTSVISSQPPPLPKSPSESWLWRTLPSVSSKKLLAGPNLGTKWYHKPQSPRTSVSTKWETIVKSSNLRHDHVRYSEELIPRVPQHSTSENFK